MNTERNITADKDSTNIFYSWPTLSKNPGAAPAKDCRFFVDSMYQKLLILTNSCWSYLKMLQGSGFLNQCRFLATWRCWKDLRYWRLEILFYLLANLSRIKRIMLHYVRTWRHPQNWNCITCCIVFRERPNDSHRYASRIQKISWHSMTWFSRWQADRRWCQYIQTDGRTRRSHYVAPLPRAK